VIVTTTANAVEQAGNLVREGAYSYLVMPEDCADRLQIMVKNGIWPVNTRLSSNRRTQAAMGCYHPTL